MEYCDHNHPEVYAYADSCSLGSSSTTFSLYYSGITCSDRPPSPSFASSPKSRSLPKERETDEGIQDSYDSGSDVIYSLKRRSDGWTGPLVKQTDPIISRLKRGRAEAIRKQEVIEVCCQLGY